jgi:hypothetical protein
MVKRTRNKCNLVNTVKVFAVECKNRGCCIKSLRTLADMNCIGCEKNINQEVKG